MWAVLHSLDTQRVALEAALAGVNQALRALSALVGPTGAPAPMVEPASPVEPAIGRPTSAIGVGRVTTPTTTGGDGKISLAERLAYPGLVQPGVELGTESIHAPAPDRNPATTCLITNTLGCACVLGLRHDGPHQCGDEGHRPHRWSD